MVNEIGFSLVVYFSKTPIVKVEWLLSTLAQFRPSTNWALEMQQPKQEKTSGGWKDVGGLKQVRRSMLETLQWPAKVV